MLSSTQPWLLLCPPKSLPSVTTSLARANNASLLRDHQYTPAATAPTTSSAIANAIASKIFSHVGMGRPPIEWHAHLARENHGRDARATSLLQILLKPREYCVVPQLRILRFKNPMSLIRKQQEF